jgi:hypothetical protein
MKFEATAVQVPITKIGLTFFSWGGHAGLHLPFCGGDGRAGRASKIAPLRCQKFKQEKFNTPLSP